MHIACLDLEGVIFPEIWINVAKKTKIKELNVTTRDISDYDELMSYRLKILKEKSVDYNLIKKVIASIKPLPGAKNFLNMLRTKFQIIILSDTFYQFAIPLMKQINYPAIFCHKLEIDNNGIITGYKLRQKDAKKTSVQKLKELNFKTIACGDSYNDLTMLKVADKGILFSPPQKVIDDSPGYPIANDYKILWEEFLKAEKEINQGKK